MSDEIKLKIDSKDRDLITELLDNARQTVGKLSKRVHLPPTTVHNRIKRLEKTGVIQNYTVNLDYKKLGRPIMAFVGVTVNYNIEGQKISQTSIAEKIKKISGVREVSILAGGMDILAKVLAKDIDDLNEIITEKLRGISGVDKTQTMIVLKEV